ncbi:4-coumarate--CoA ligase 1-like [Melitaea cinxia]|uniref:4-coumarate--CoA ligase 1-like n=1 Tax=Melitaea cinxia TaxID=113334 RepID=UPI001E27346C|nr:4-coumarate--CoA ligase 1-like [Melitaea cinxia]
MSIGPSYHFGHLILEYMKRNSNIVGQIDAATGKEETYGSILSRSIRLARSMRSFGLKPGDVLAVGGRNHLDIRIPFYSAVFNGLPVLGVDPYFKYDEILTLFKQVKPKIVFCQTESLGVHTKVAADLGLDIKIVTFGDKECSFSKFIEEYDDGESEQEFKVLEIDIEKIYAFLVCTSGTTGYVKVAAFQHRPFMMKLLGLLKRHVKANIKGTRVLTLSPIQWITSYLMTYVSPLTGDTIIQTSILDDFDHVIDIINKYKPVTAVLSPTLMAFLMSRKDDVDFSSFRTMGIAGSKIYSNALRKFKEILNENTLLGDAYGQTEMIGPVLLPGPLTPLGSCGSPLPGYILKLVDPDTSKEILEPNVTGELWAKGPMFAAYYNDPEETAIAFTEDGFFKTGDLFYRDENNNFYFVERIRTLIKYQNSHVLSSEIEELISRLPGVKEVCVIGLPHEVDGEHPAACVVRDSNSSVTAQEIRDLVASKLSRNKELRGGVIFVDSLPHTSTGKVVRKKLLQQIENCKIE